ncbi:MAG: HAMP domain-containing histidine kinase [Sinobacterium sp.]|nr:HAMP domain-containing histidine kinase [Sinobacterium sp.]
MSAFQLFRQTRNNLTLLLWLRCISLGALFVTASVASLLPENFFASLVSWPLLSVVILASLILSLLNLAIKNKLDDKLHISLTLILDSLLWFMAISATGGAINPAVSYALILLCVSAISLPVKFTFSLLVIMAMAYAALLEFSPHHHHAMMLSWHLWGMWLLFVLTATIMLWVVQNLTRLIRERDSAIAVFREQQVRDEKLIALGTLSASIAHELSTPLSTISILVEDDESPEGELIKAQLQRCKSAIETLRVERESSYMHGDNFIKKLSDEMLLLSPSANINWSNLLADTLYTSALLEHALLALINNAVQASSGQVDVVIFESVDLTTITITHEGDPITEKLLHQLGKNTVKSQKGLGIGYYLANASIEQLGGYLFIQNLPQGVRTTIELARDAHFVP